MVYLTSAIVIADCKHLGAPRARMTCYTYPC